MTDTSHSSFRMATTKFHALRTFKRGLVIAILGPIIGYLIAPMILSTCFSLMGPDKVVPFPNGIIREALGLYAEMFGSHGPTIFLVCYVVGFPSSVLTALSFQWLAKHRGDGLELTSANAAAGFSLSLTEGAILAYFFIDDIISPIRASMIFSLAFGLIGALSAVICQLLAAFISPVRLPDRGSAH